MKLRSGTRWRECPGLEMMSRTVRDMGQINGGISREGQKNSLYTYPFTVRDNPPVRDIPSTAASVPALIFLAIASRRAASGSGPSPLSNSG